MNNILSESEIKRVIQDTPLKKLLKLIRSRSEVKDVQVVLKSGRTREVLSECN